jgi:hypothetical protein
MTNEKITQSFIDSALGTCQSIQDVMNTIDLEDEDLVDWGMVDDQIFLCDDCSWWCEMSDMAEDGVCNDCTMMTECDTCFVTIHQDELNNGTTCDECFDFGDE